MGAGGGRASKAIGGVGTTYRSDLGGARLAEPGLARSGVEVD